MLINLNYDVVEVFGEIVYLEGDEVWFDDGMLYKINGKSLDCCKRLNLLDFIKFVL